MPNPSEGITPLPRKDLCVFYLLDTSGSMKGEPINILNMSMDETIDALEGQAEYNGDAHVKIAAMTFDSNPKWINPAGPEYVEDFVWEEVSAGGKTNVGLALDELNSKLTTDQFLASKTGGLPPVIIFMTDGMPTDDYQAALDRCLNNKMFRKATRIGIGVGNNPDLEMIAHIAGDSEAVIRPKDLKTFAKLIQFVSMTSTDIASVAGNGSGIGTGAQAVKTAIEEGNLDPAEVKYNGERYIEPQPIDQGSTENVTISTDKWL